jgi:hypothetical protein
MVINKNLSGSESIMVNLANSISNGSADAWQLTSANAITQLSAVAVSGGNFSATVPAQSITLYVVSAGAAAPQAARVLLMTVQAMPATDMATLKPEDREPGALALNDSVNPTDIVVEPNAGTDTRARKNVELPAVHAHGQSARQSVASELELQDSVNLFV